MPQTSTPRICKSCGRLLPIEAFERNRPNVWRSTCKECRAWKKTLSKKERKEYELEFPRPKIGDDFYCKICQRTTKVQQNRDVCLDHDHKTGKIRGYICNNCNTGIGALRDDIKVLARAKKWLKGTLNSIFSV